MIPRSLQDVQTSTWQRSLADAICDPAELIELLELPADLLEGARQSARHFSLRVPRGYARLIKKGDPQDPLLRQILPLSCEQTETSGFSTDPVGDQQAISANGLLQKYPGRALLLTTGACAIHCRYCFRRHFPYAEQRGQAEQWRSTLQQLRQSRCSEVILSGGDPLSLSNKRLHRLFSQLAQLPDLKRIRIHSRYPVVLPERIDEAFIALGKLLPGRPVMVIHCNHSRELSAAARDCLARMSANHWVIFNQTVLLRHVNDNPEQLAQLSEMLFANHVQPYYLHQMDPVQGAAHFVVCVEQARRIHQQLQERLPGYLVPKLVQEIAGQPCKTPL
jgi:EF-P beta-lysylation protein EpmB